MMTKEELEVLKSLQQKQRDEQKKARAKQLRQFKKMCMELWNLSPNEISMIINKFNDNPSDSLDPDGQYF